MPGWVIPQKDGGRLVLPMPHEWCSMNGGEPSTAGLLKGSSMRPVLLGAAILLIAVSAACDSGADSREVRTADNTVEICGEWKVVLKRYSGGSAPEYLAYKKAMQDAYEGHGDPAAQRSAEVAYDGAWARDLRPMVERATDDDLKAALTKQLQHFEKRAAGKTAPAAEAERSLRKLDELCIVPSAEPSPTG